MPIGVIGSLYAWHALPRDNAGPSGPFDLLSMLMLSPGLALFLYGVSSIPETGTVTTPKVWMTMLAGVILLAGFVLYSFELPDPMLDLRLFRNRDMSIASIAMFVFVLAFMGAGLLFPSYFIQVRGESTLTAGLLVAPQGLGAMITIPIAGVLADKIPVGRTVPFAMLLVGAGLIAFTRVDANTSYWSLCGSLFVMGLGMGGAMMPIMTSALRTLSGPDVARGSTILSIIQRIGGSVGAAIMSVVLTDELNDSPVIPGAFNPDGTPMTEAGLAIAARQNSGILTATPVDSSIVQRGLDFAAGSFSHAFWVALVAVLVTFIPIALMSRGRASPRFGTRTRARHALPAGGIRR